MAERFNAGKAGWQDLPYGFPPNPDYGTGCTIRNVRLRTEDARVHIHLVDNVHDICCTLEHDGSKLVSINGGFERFPTTLCPEAAEILSELVGAPLNLPMREFYRGGRARRYCTHLFDLVALGLCHTARGDDETLFQASVPDTLGDEVEMSVRVNGEIRHAWTAADDVIRAPKALAGGHLLKGFQVWACDHFSGVDYDAACLLAKTYLVSSARRVSASDMIGTPLVATGMTGVCYAFDPERVERGSYTGRNQVLVPGDA